jgi:hypothetical protein
MFHPGEKKTLQPGTEIGGGIVLIVVAVLVGIMLVPGRTRPTPGSEPGYRRFDDLAAASRIPPQENYSPADDPGPPPPFVEMGSPRASECIVRDVELTIEGAGWRWTYLNPTLRFYLRENARQRFAMDFSVIPTTFRDTGPVTLSCYIDKRLLTRLWCPRPGDYHVEQAVPDSWLKGRGSVMVQAVLDKVWTAPADGARLGYVLFRAGFLTAHQ